MAVDKRIFKIGIEKKLHIGKKYRKILHHLSMNGHLNVKHDKKLLYITSRRINRKRAYTLFLYIWYVDPLAMFFYVEAHSFFYCSKEFSYDYWNIICTSVFKEAKSLLFWKRHQHWWHKRRFTKFISNRVTFSYNEVEARNYLTIIFDQFRLFFSRLTSPFHGHRGKRKRNRNNRKNNR